MNKHVAFLSGSVAGAALMVTAGAYAALGGSDGVRIPYVGHLENSGSAVNGNYTLRFDIHDAQTNGNACAGIPDVATSVFNGAFNAVIGPVAESCVIGKQVWVGVSVKSATDSGFTALAGRQQVFPAVGALTSGIGDFRVPGILNVGGNATVAGNVTAAGTVSGFVDPGFVAASVVGYNAYCPAGTNILWAHGVCPSGQAVRTSNHQGATGWYVDCTPNAGVPTTISATCARMPPPPSYPGEIP